MQQWFDSAKCAAEQARSLQEGRRSKGNNSSRRSSSGVLTVHETYLREDDRLTAAEQRAARAEALVESANKRAARAEANLAIVRIQLRLATIEHERTEIEHEIEAMRIAQLTTPASFAVLDKAATQKPSRKPSFFSRRGSGGSSSSSIGSSSSSGRERGGSRDRSHDRGGGRERGSGREHGDSELNGAATSPRASMEYSGNV